MSTPEERARSLVWAGCFMVEIAHDLNVDLEIRRKAVAIARHLPTFEEVSISLPPKLLETQQFASWTTRFKLGPLRYDTRLDWPER